MSSKIIVKSKPERFRRAGHTFHREGVVIDTAELSKAQLDALSSEPMLVVADYVEPKAESAAKGGKK